MPIYSYGCDEKSHPEHLPLLSSRQDWKFARFQSVMNEASSKRLNYVRTILPTHCPHYIALSHSDFAILSTAWAASPVIMKELV